MCPFVNNLTNVLPEDKLSELIDMPRTIVEGCKVKLGSPRNAYGPPQTNAIGVLRVLNMNHPLQVVLVEVTLKSSADCHRVWWSASLA